MTLQVNIIVLLFGALQGILLSIALLSKRERHPSHVFLTLFLVVVCLQLTSKVITKMWLMENAGIFYVLSYSLPFLVGPSIYLFVRSRFHDKSFVKTDVLHAIPFLLHCAAVIIMSLGFRKYLLWVNEEWIRAASQLLSLAIYFWMSHQLIRKAGLGSSVTLKRFLNYVAAAEAIITITLALMVIYYRTFPDVRLLFIVLSVVVYWITWKMMTDPSGLTMPVVVSRSLETHPVTRYAHSGLKEEEAARIETELLDLMINQKVFTDSALTIDKLAGSLNTTRHHLSQVLNERVRRPYAEYISELRLDEAQRRLADPKSTRYTIAAIALDCGFSTVSTFNESFKRKFGLTPSTFRNTSGPSSRSGQQSA